MSFFERLFGGAAHARYRCAMQAFDAGRYEEALAGFRHALTAPAPRGDPILHLAAFYAAEAATHLGRAALTEGDAARALVWLEPALHGPSVSPELLRLSAVAYLASDATASSLGCLQALLAIDPGRGEAHLLAAVVCHARGESDRAQTHLEALRAHGGALALSDVVRRVLAARAQQSVDVAMLLRDFLPSPQSSGV